ncbi:MULTISPECIES: Crp/Fnr family transcriptional regulator [unclassified Synechocystis]|uniref:Crp/Fnr family transcriptional regulator n=1 Tax=unclassified Synechocystis TaxID=2640012 RepID=UPI00040ED426|nr:MULTISPECIES: Crp/Fnr family transcriptional regulator [unclassified Synechocystis]AIE73793.1 transcriptional regulator, Crp/Fnr family [Synechocystis sp. PCC 6714]MCT0252385.1 Crp/Fnr family transcriptional regulator [Synechocystis sp. CS-94]
MTPQKPSGKQLKQLANEISFFRAIPKDLLMETITYLSFRNYPCSQSILFDNYYGGSIYFIAEGWIKVCVIGECSKNSVYTIYGSGEMVGAIAAVEEDWNPREAVTLSPAKIWSIPTQDFLNLLNQHPQAGIQVAIFASKRLRKLNQYFRLREADSVAKVAHILLELVNHRDRRINPKKYRVLIPNLPHREMALLSGVTRETVTRTLIKLEKKGLILRQGATIEIVELDALQQLVSGDPTSV